MRCHPGGSGLWSNNNADGLSRHTWSRLLLEKRFKCIARLASRTGLARFRDEPFQSFVDVRLKIRARDIATI